MGGGGGHKVNGGPGSVMKRTKGTPGTTQQETGSWAVIPLHWGHARQSFHSCCCHHHSHCCPLNKNCTPANYYLMSCNKLSGLDEEIICYLSWYLLVRNLGRVRWAFLVWGLMWLQLVCQLGYCHLKFYWARGSTRHLISADKLVLVVACKGLCSCPGGSFHKAAWVTGLSQSEQSKSPK